MKLKVAVLVAAMFLVFAGSAEAFVWHLSLYKAKAATKNYEHQICERDIDCIASGANCTRVSESRIDCVGGTIDDTVYGELECSSVYHWGVDRLGYAKLRIGDPHCYYLE